MSPWSGTPLPSPDPNAALTTALAAAAAPESRGRRRDPRLRLYAAWMLPVPDRKEIHASLMADHPDPPPVDVRRPRPVEHPGRPPPSIPIPLHERARPGYSPRSAPAPVTASHATPRPPTAGLLPLLAVLAAARADAPRAEAPPSPPAAMPPDGAPLIELRPRPTGPWREMVSYRQQAKKPPFNGVRAIPPAPRHVKMS